MLFLDAQWKERQRADLKRALTRRRVGTRWGMYIDPARCTGCRGCQVACKAENNTPPGVSYIVVLEHSQGTAPYARRRYVPKPCMQCAHPSCVIVCPVSATYPTHDGIVVMDYMKCIGCRYCMTACPYSSRYFDVGDEYGKGCDGEAAYDHRPSTEYSRKWPREHDISPIGNARKCHYCQHRLERGLLPACIEACPTDAMVFGDIDDDQSLVRILISENATYRLKEELGNEPKTYYRAS